MEAQQTRLNVAPLTVRCCSQRPLGRLSGDATNAAPRPHIDAATVTEAIPLVRPAAETDRSSREFELAPCQTR